MLATLIAYLLKGFDIGDQNIILVFILSVLMISKVTSGYAYGIIFSILSVLTFNFFFVKPYFTFTAIQPGYPITFLIMLLAAFLTSTTMVKIKTQVKVAVAREKNTEILYELNKKLLKTRGITNIINLTTEYISSVYERSVIFYVEDPMNGGKGIFKQYKLDPSNYVINAPDEEAVAHWAFINKKRAGAGTDTLMGANGFYMPIISQGMVLGVVGLDCTNGKGLTHDNRVFLRMIASLVAMALERQKLSDEQREMMISSEKEVMRSNLLRAISHDLRTPLTSILGASSAILENKQSISEQTHDKLLSDIKEDSQWLIRMVENLLSITRINESAAKVSKIPQAVEEVISESLSRVKNKYPGYHFSVKVPDKILFVPMDAILIEQVIINILENAIKHSQMDSLIVVQVTEVKDCAVFVISDNGKGIDPDEIQTLFDGYSSKRDKSPDSSRGMGIGLSICRSIIIAHGGVIEAENKPEGGAIFRFTLPVKGSEDSGQ